MTEVTLMAGMSGPRVLVSVDDENAANVWWSAAHAADLDVAPLGWRIFETSRFSQICLTVREARELERWCSRLPGWERGPEYAPSPLIFEHLAD